MRRASKNLHEKSYDNSLLDIIEDVIEIEIYLDQYHKVCKKYNKKDNL